VNNIKTIKWCSESKFREKGSLFTGKAYPVNNAEEIEKILRDTRKKYFDATHHCYAYKIYDGGSKYSDGGEPAGSAGVRILNAIEHYGLTNILTIVVRYFGGTKLGLGPLGKAYYNSALLAIQNSKIVEKTPAKKVTIEADLSFAKQVQKIITSMKGEILNSSFGEKMRTECMVDANGIEQFISRLRESTKDKSKIVVEERITFL
jgi:uncharacterized YigZ family protein